MNDAGIYQGAALPVGSKGRLSSGWWGMCTVIATEAALFAYLFFSYFYIAAQAHGEWPPGGPPKLLIAVIDTIILVAGSFTMMWGERGIRRGNARRLLWGLGVTIALGAIFLVLQSIEWRSKPYSLSTNVYGSLYFTTTGFHVAHVIVGLLILCALFAWTALGYFGARRHSAVSIGVMYWHFVTVVWIGVFAIYYAMPYVAPG